MILTNKHYFSQVAIGLVITLAVLTLQFAPVSYLSKVVNRLDGILYDLKLSYLAPWSASETNIHIIDIDEQSLQTIGRMPWPRSQFAALTEKLTELGAITIAFDILFTEPEINPANKVLSKLVDPQSINQVKAIAQTLDGDYWFAQAMQQNEVILATLFHQQKNIQKGHLATAKLNNLGDNSHHHLHTFAGYSANTEKLAKQAISQGFVNAVFDDDGFIRRSPLVIEHNGNIYPSLALAAFQSYTLADNIELHWQQQQQQAFLTAVKIGHAVIPTDNKGQLLLPFRKSAYYYPYTSAADILMNKITDDRFENAVVFIGTSATGLADLRTTPVSLTFPGVEIHATLFDALMSPETQPYRPDWWQAAVAILLIFCGLFFALLLPKLSPRATEVIALLTFIFVVCSNLVLWQKSYIDLPLTSLILLIMALSTYYISYGFIKESSRRKQVKAIFEQYVPPAHINEILEQPDSANLIGKKKNLTVLFSDIRSFTTIAEQLPPEQLSLWLNQFFSAITRNIFQHQGTIDKYVGDMVMAFWGAPLNDEQQATHSVKSAFAMLSTVEQLKTVYQDKGWPTVQIGIGINSGEMNVGDMGSRYRLNYTVLGDAVNLGSRLESLTKYYNLALLIGEQTKRCIADESPMWFSELALLTVDKVNVKGKSQPVTIYSPIAAQATDEQINQCQQFNKMINHYFCREFKLAQQVLTAISHDFFNAKLLSIYQQRISEMLANPPNDDWQGVVIHQEK